MTKTFPPTALKTKNCPPHHYIIDRSNVGICKKCGTVRNFGQFLRRELWGAKKKGGRQ